MGVSPVWMCTRYIWMCVWCIIWMYSDELGGRLRLARCWSYRLAGGIPWAVALLDMMEPSQMAYPLVI